MRAEPGPYQADVVYSKDEGPTPWLGIMPRLGFDDQDRPVVGALEHGKGWHRMVLENGKWIERVKNPTVTSGKATEKPQDEEEDEDENPDSKLTDVMKLNLPHKILRIDPQYFHETGNLLYAAETPRKTKDA